MTSATAEPTAGPGAALARAATAILCVGALGVLALLGYAWHRFGGSLGWVPIQWYGALSLALVALLWCAFRLRPAARVLLAISCAAASLLLYGTEAALAILADYRVRSVQTQLAERTGVPFDSRAVPDVVQGLRASGIQAVPSVVPKVILQYSAPNVDPRLAWTAPLFPLAGVADRVTVQLCNEDGQFRRYGADQHGFANPGTGWPEAGRGVALIGDSFTHGYCVDADRSYAGRLQQRWPETVNLGTGGSGPLAELATLTEYAAPLRPRIVIWQYFGNDIDDLATERLSSTLLRYLDPAFSQGLVKRQTEIDAALDPWIERLLVAGRGRELTEKFGWRAWLTLHRLRGMSATVVGSSRSNERREELVLWRAILSQASSRVAAWGGRLYFVVVPEWERYYRPAALARGDFRDEVLNSARSLGLPVIDLDSAVRAHPRRDQLFARQEMDVSHFSALGHDLMAQEIMRAVQSAYTAREN